MKKKRISVGSEEVSTADDRDAEKLIAKKDFVIRQEPYQRVILAGEDISDVPKKYYSNLRTEGVL